MKPALAILAAGASRRLGQCKALVEWSGETTLERLVAAARAFDAVAPLVVTGADHDAISRRLPPGVEVVRNEAWARGRTGSVRCARDARPGFDLCLAPVDTPLVPAEVFDTLLAAWLERDSPAEGWLAPRAATEPARFGHPVIAGRALLARLDELSDDAPLRELRRFASPLWSVPTARSAILDDLDTSADLQHLRSRERTAD